MVRLAIMISGITGAVALLVHLQSELALTGLLLAFGGLAWAARRFGQFRAVEQAAASHPWTLRLLLILAVLALILLLREDVFGLLMLATLFIYLTVCTGLTVQLGSAGLSNFAAAAFMGTGGYVAALAGLPGPVDLIMGGVAAAVVGTVLALPMLRTRGHYASLTTLAFGVMFTLFVNASDHLGGPQGVKLPGVILFGWDFAQDLTIVGVSFSFYANYVLLAAAIAGLAIGLYGLINRSWIGLWFDVVRLDEVAGAVFGLKVGWWKLLAFTIGNFLIGVAGALYAQMTGFIAPPNFQIGDSLLLVSIVILGGLGNPWGLVPATLLVVLLPEKLQFIQEYRLLIYALAVIVVLLIRPDGMLPRRLRRLDGEVSS